MNEQLEKALEQIAEVTSAIKENNGTEGLRKEELVADFKQALDEHKQALLDEIPLRPGEFQSDPVQRAVDQYTGRYRQELNVNPVLRQVSGCRVYSRRARGCRGLQFNHCYARGRCRARIANKCPRTTQSKGDLVRRISHHCIT